MRVPVQRRRRGLKFNITPLIDIVFLLIIFFLVASHFVQSDATESVDLPLAASARDDAEEAPRRLVITVLADGTLLFRGQAMAVEELQGLIGTEGTEDPDSTEVWIRSDRQATWDRIEPIMLACASGGIRNIRFAVIHAEP